MTKPFVIGLTGSIGMGKSTTALMFKEIGIPVWDADQAVHKLYAKGGEAVALVKTLAPEVVVDGAVSRDLLKVWVTVDPSRLKQLENIVHPLVARARAQFLSEQNAPIVVLDIPLLFENEFETTVDLIVVVSVPEVVQEERVMARGTMTKAQFDLIRSKQMPDAQKRAKADVVIDTSSMDTARKQVKKVIENIRARLDA